MKFLSVIFGLVTKCRHFQWFPVVFIITLACRNNQSNQTEQPLFSLIDRKQTHIDFINQVEYTEDFNTYTYRNFYNGAGVGIGDINNDGLPDIYFCSNQTGNKLYLNKGDFVFQDITESAGAGCPGSWSTGVSMADVNGDGWLDIYVCKSGNPKSEHRKNELFLNNGDLTFSEKAGEYGLDNFGLSNHAAFFDFDRDGDLDCYLLNNSFQSVTEFDMRPGQRQIPDSLGGNKLLRNDNGHFTDVTDNSGIYSSKIGFGLGATIGDVDRDGWLDIYVSNDFFERDYLYINNGDGTFKEDLENRLTEISQGAMGADMADINNDAWPEIYATEMTPEYNSRLKTKALFDTWETYQLKVRSGYYHQFPRNALQLNNKNGSFSEIGRLSGVSSTDWSWGALITDLDNDGWKDIFVANGIYKDLLDRDFLDIYSNPSIMRSMIKQEESAILRLIEMIPSVRIPNYAFHNNGDLTFTNLSGQWGLNTPSFSNGAAYGDLDNDGDLDLVVNNVNMPPFVYMNEARIRQNASFLNVTLKGGGKNTAAIGANVTLYCKERLFYQELIPSRGFQSSVDPRLHFGLGESETIDSLTVQWPDGSCTGMQNIPVNQFLIMSENNTAERRCPDNEKNNYSSVLKNVVNVPGLDFRHIENDFVDFERDRLIFQMVSNDGPHIATADINSDGFEDLYICGARDQPGALFVQNSIGTFRKVNGKLFDSDKIQEDTDCVFFDADSDGDEDLYVASGGNEFPVSSSALADRLYINNAGSFVKSDQVLPSGKYESTSCVEPADFDNDGDKDLFVGIRMLPFAYGLPVNGYLLENDGNGNFRDITSEKAPGLKDAGMITDMVWADIDNDLDSDMVIVGEWMPVKVFMNIDGRFSDESVKFGLSNTEGWWKVIKAKDLNGDGNVDFVLGNHGLNTFFRASIEKPVSMYVNDFDLNGSIEQIICTFNGEKSYPVVMKDELVGQIPSLDPKYPKFDNYKDQTVTDIFSEEVLKRSLVLKSRIMESCLLINSGKNTLILEKLPKEAQFTPVYAIAADDFDMDGLCDIILGGNQSRAKPQTGINKGSYGLFLRGRPDGKWQYLSPGESGIFITGEVRDFSSLNIKGERIIIVAKNNDELQFYKY